MCQKNLGCLCYLNRDIYFLMDHLSDRCKDVGRPVIRINRNDFACTTHSDLYESYF